MRSGAKAERAYDERWGDLALYNAEVYGGIVHTPETDERMARKQRAHDRIARSGDRWALWTCSLAEAEGADKGSEVLS